MFQLAGVLRFGCLLLRLDLHQTLTTRNVRAIETQGDWLPGEKPQAREVEWIVLGCLATGALQWDTDCACLRPAHIGIRRGTRRCSGGW